MKVRELVNALNEFDGELEVVGDGSDGTEFEILGVEEYDEENEHCIVINVNMTSRL